MIFHKHDIVDYYESRKISCGVVLEVEDRRLRIFNEHGKELKISPTRALIATKDPDFPFSESKDKQIERLKAISQKREEIKKRIDLKELWEVVGHETDEISIEDLAELFFGNHNDLNHTASLLRAIFEDKLYFRVRPDVIEVFPPDKVQQALIQREKERERNIFVKRSAEFLSALKGSEKIDVKSSPEGLIPLLEEAALCGSDWTSLKNVKEMISEAGLAPAWDPFRILVRLGIWSEDENLTLRAEHIPVEFSAEAMAEALQISNKPLNPLAEDLTEENLITIDSVFTRDIDDALSLTSDGDDLLLGVHITDVAHYVEYDSLLDKEIRSRATSIYLPEMTIPMIPPVLSELAGSLVVNQTRPAISLIVRLGPDYSLKTFRIFESIIKVKERLSYEEADERISVNNSRESKLYSIAVALRKARIEAGAIIFKDPELSVHVLNGKIEVSCRDRESPSQILVSELMILANSLFAKFMVEHGLPGVFRSQPPPLEKIEYHEEEYDPVLSYRAKKLLSRGDISTKPEAHSTLGVEVYTTATSPLRRYVDLMVQRQLKSVLQSKAPALSPIELEKNLSEICYRLDRAALMERERLRYFFLKYLEQIKNEEFETIVLQSFPRFYLVQIKRFAFNAALSVPQGITLNPYDKVLARIEKIKPRDNKLSLSFIRLL